MAAAKSWWGGLSLPLGSQDPLGSQETTPEPEQHHPYYPLDVSIPHFRENETELPLVLASFGGIIVIVLLAAFRIGQIASPRISCWDRFVVCWFSLCAFLHLFFEGYFIRNHAQLAGMQSLFGQAWKEYALSDSRYLTSDPFMLCVEYITVLVWGPLCCAIVYTIVNRHPLRHPLQIIMCVGHLYGVALYYSTSLTERAMSGTMHSRPEFLYFWVYYVGFNGPWVVVPTVLLLKSIDVVRRALGALDKVEATLGQFDGQMGSVEVSTESKKAR